MHRPDLQRLLGCGPQRLRQHRQRQRPHSVASTASLAEGIIVVQPVQPAEGVGQRGRVLGLGVGRARGARIASASASSPRCSADEPPGAARAAPSAPPPGPAYRLRVVLIPVTIPDALTDGGHVEVLRPDDLPADWQAWPSPASTQTLGADWFDARRSVALVVPSAVVPHERNVLLNPTHPRFGELEIGDAQPFPVDPRLTT